MAVFAVQAEEVTKNVTFSDYTAGTQYAENEKHDLGDGLVIYTTACHFTTQLRIYSSASNNGYVVSDALPGNITKMTFNAGYKVDNLLVYGSNDGTTWTKVGSVATTTTSYKDYELSFTGSYNRFKLDVEGANQIRVAKLSVTYTTDGEETPAAPAKPTLPAACNFDDAMTVEITDVADGATAYYSLNNETDWVAGTSVTITETTTVYAKVVKDELSSTVVNATYTKNVPVDPNAKEVEATISFASTAQRTSQSSTEQVWVNEGVTFTNSGSVANYSNPVRLYSGSNVVVEHEAMTKIVFACTSASYASALKSSIGAAATVDGTNVTVIFANPVDEFTISRLTAQVRLSSLTVTYLTTQMVVKTPVIAPESCGFYAGEAVEVTITAEEGTIYYTLDGNDPTTSSDIYLGAITINETTTVKAIAVVDGTESEIATAIYTKGIEGSVADALAAYVDGEKFLAVVTGYIVGYVNGTAVGDEGADCVFGAENVEKNTNILIADDPYETDYTKCLAVQLPNNEIRTALNLVDNPDNYQVKVVIKASLEKYLNTAGLKDATAAELLEELYHTLTVTEAGYATLFLGFNARIPSAIEAYTVTAVNDGWVSLTQVTGVLPSNEGVIIKAPAGDYKFFNEATATADVTGNLLEGSAYNKNIDKEAYVLGNVNGVGLYKAKMTDGTWLNNANKAYLPATSVPNKTVEFYGFDWGSTTGIENIEGVAGNNFGEGAIYDLTGRKINSIAVTGIYIIDGKKVFIRK